MARSTADKEAAAELLATAEANTKGPVLSPEQTLVMFALVARQGFIAQNDLGVPVDAGDREALEAEKLLATIKREQNALWVKLTDAGWAWVEDNMNKAVPQSHSVLHHLMIRIGAHLEEAGENLKSFIGEPEVRPDGSGACRLRLSRSRYLERSKAPEGPRNAGPLVAAAAHMTSFSAPSPGTRSAGWTRSSQPRWRRGSCP